LPPYDKSIKAAVFSSDGTQLLAADNDDVIHLWDITTGSEIITFKGHKKILPELHSVMMENKLSLPVMMPVHVSGILRVVRRSNALQATKVGLIRRYLVLMVDGY